MHVFIRQLEADGDGQPDVVNAFMEKGEYYIAGAPARHALKLELSLPLCGHMSIAVHVHLCVCVCVCVCVCMRLSGATGLLVYGYTRIMNCLLLVHPNASARERNMRGGCIKRICGCLERIGHFPLLIRCDEHLN